MSYDTVERSQRGGAPVECYQFRMLEQVWRFTSSDQLQAVAGEEYTPEVIRRTGADFSQEDDAGEIEITLPASNPVAQLFRVFTPASPVKVTVYTFHRSEPGSVITAFPGRVLGASFADGEATLRCAALSGALLRNVPTLTYQKRCNWTVFSPGCGVDPTPFAVVAPLAVVDGAKLRSPAFALKADGWWTGGWAEIETGERRPIVEHVGDRVTLMSPFPDLLAGGHVTAFPGCDGLESTCAHRYNNLRRHLGFPRIPARNPYQGSMV